MYEDIYPLLVEVIKNNSSWIRISDSEKLRKRYVFLDRCTRTLVSRAITFKASVRCGKYREGHEWHVSEDDIQKAVVRLKSQDKDFAKRISNVEMTANDAQRIIEIASHGVLKLNLEE